MSDQDRLIALVDQCRDQIAEHCDSVRIFATIPSQDGESNTVSYTCGGGNLYAQYGQIDEWRVMQKELARIHARGEDVP